MISPMLSSEGRSAQTQLTITVVAIAYLLTLAAFYRTSALNLLIAVPFTALLYAALFSVGDERINAWSRLPDNAQFNVVLFPLLLSVAFFGYALLIGNNPLVWPTIALPLVLAIPAIFFF